MRHQHTLTHRVHRGCGLAVLAGLILATGACSATSFEPNSDQTEADPALGISTSPSRTPPPSYGISTSPSVPTSPRVPGR